MSTRHPTNARTFHPRALAALGAPACIAMLSVARDLRSGAIPPEHYDQQRSCGTACCIYGHMVYRINNEYQKRLDGAWHSNREEPLCNLFAAWSNCSPEGAARKMPANMEEIRGIGLRALEAIKDKTYIYDICTCCGATVHRP